MSNVILLTFIYSEFSTVLEIEESPLYWGLRWHRTFASSSDNSSGRLREVSFIRWEQNLTVEHIPREQRPGS